MRVLRSLPVPTFHDSVHLGCLASHSGCLIKWVGSGGRALGSESAGPHL